MKREEVFQKLTEVFQDVFDDDGIVLSDSTSAEDIEDWDSLSHITLLSSIEEEFGLHFQMKTVTALKNVGEMVDLILSMAE